MALFLKALSTQGSRPKVNAMQNSDTSRGSTNTSKSSAFRNRPEIDAKHREDEEQSH